MKDLISRQAAIDVIANQSTMLPHDRVIAVDTLVALPSAQPEERALHESCTDCPLYNHERHSCPRFNKVIPETLREIQPEPDKRLEKIADLVDGTIDHFDREDAMDLLYQIKEVLDER